MVKRSLAVQVKILGTHSSFSALAGPEKRLQFSHWLKVRMQNRPGGLVLMAESLEETKPRNSFAAFIYNILKRPVEFGLIGASVVLVLHLANTADILPRVFKGAGFELEFRESQQKVVQTVVDTAGGVDEIKNQIAELQSEIQLLKQDIVDLSQSEGREVNVYAASEAKIWETQTDVAKISRQLVDENRIVDGNGVIWIGTFDPSAREWVDSSLQAESQLQPNELLGEKIRLKSDLNVRADFPERNENYFSKIKALGVATEGMGGVILGSPKKYERENGVQYWAEVQIQYKPYVGVVLSED